MATIYPATFDGGHNLYRGTKVVIRDGETTLAETLIDVATDLASGATDLAAIHAAIGALAAKLDADAGVTDTDYAATYAAAVTGLDTGTILTIAG